MPVLYSIITAAQGVLLFPMFLLDAPQLYCHLARLFYSVYLVLAPVHG